MLRFGARGVLKPEGREELRLREEKECLSRHGAPRENANTITSRRDFSIGETPRNWLRRSQPER
jgi:hypothetical protein